MNRRRLALSLAALSVAAVAAAPSALADGCKGSSKPTPATAVAHEVGEVADLVGQGEVFHETVEPLTCA